MSIRIIAGKYKGISIDTPDSVRPTLSRARQSLFDTLESMPIEMDDGTQGGFFHRRVVLDCFAGSGALGIEALSRGAGYAYFVDNSKNAISVLHSNIEKIQAQKHSAIIFSDINKIKNYNKMHPKNGKCDLIFLDPPYYKNISIENTIDVLIAAEWTSENAIFVMETAEKNAKNFDRENFCGNSGEKFRIIAEKKIGISVFVVAKICNY
jgi:16S rRNA (guanine(966)-N(2))-methyltransferase RsmD